MRSTVRLLGWALAANAAGGAAVLFVAGSATGVGEATRQFMLWCGLQ